jgi:hypothetical protein
MKTRFDKLSAWNRLQARGSKTNRGRGPAMKGTPASNHIAEILR